MRSDNVTKGAERAPNRSLFYALGYTPEDLEKPLIAVVSAHSDIVPGHMNLDKLTDAVKSGIEAAGGTPFMVPAIGVCDGIAMGHVGMKYSLASRELICDSVETMFMAHQFDGCVLVPNCDKIVPGMVMAAVRMNVPAVVCSGGPMLAGTYDGQEVSLSKMFEAAGRKVFLGGNIGAALLPQLADVTSDAVAVVELSSFQLISMRRSPKVAVVTNVTPNHLDHHKDMQEYIDAKRNILLWQTPPCRAVLGFENDITRGMEKDCKGEQVWFTRLHETDRGAFLRESDDTLCYAENGVVTPILPRKEIQLRGLHNVENLLAACAAVWGRVPIEAMRQVGSTFTGVEHRIEPVRTLDGVTYYNDSIASSPTRTIAGLRSFDQKIILIAGGYDKKIPYEPLAPEVLAHVKTLVLMGATGPRIEKAVRECDGFAGSGLTILHADSMQHAVELARGAAKPGDVVSLSPASASFDLYPNFEVRGRDYKNIVKNLK